MYNILYLCKAYTPIEIFLVPPLPLLHKNLRETNNRSNTATLKKDVIYKFLVVLLMSQFEIRSCRSILLNCVLPRTWSSRNYASFATFGNDYLEEALSICKQHQQPILAVMQFVLKTTRESSSYSKSHSELTYTNLS